MTDTAYPDENALTPVSAAAEAGRSPDAHMPPGAPIDVAPERRTLLGQALHDTFARPGARVGLAWIAILVVLGVFAPLIANSHPLLLKLKGQPTQFPLFASLSAIDVGLIIYFFYAVTVLAWPAKAPLKLAFLLWPLAPLSLVVGIGIKWKQFLSFSIYGQSLKGALGTGLWFSVNTAILLGALAVLVGTVYATILLFRAGRNRPVLLGISIFTAALLIFTSFTVREPQNIIYERFRELQAEGQVERIVHTIIPYSPNDRLRDRPEETLKPPSRTHWLGTTEFGEDMLSRMLYACRIALAIGLIATSIAAAIGILVGGLMGYYAGWVDLIGMRFLEMVEAIPKLILLLIVTVSFGRSLYLMMIVIGLVSWTGDARFIRAEFLKLRNLDFVQAAIATGLSRWSIIFRHMLPNGVSPVLVSASFGVAGAILLESVLSFLGLGLGPDDPSWGQMLEQARKGGTGFNWWIATFPGLAIFLTVFSYILIGESMRDALDPRLQKRD